jgi:putative transposase
MDSGSGSPYARSAAGGSGCASKEWTGPSVAGVTTEAIHSETGQTPHDRYHVAERPKRSVRLESVVQHFYRREPRTVDRDHSDVSIDYRTFAVDPKLRGDRVEVRWDPFQSDGAFQEVQIYSLEGVYLGLGRLYQREKGAHPQPEPSGKKDSIEPTYLNALLASYEISHQERRQQGLDFESASHRNRWSFTSFATLVARLLGRSGGLSALTPAELEALRAFHSRHDRLHESLVRTAVAQAEFPTIPHVLWQLQSLLPPGDK